MTWALFVPIPINRHNILALSHPLSITISNCINVFYCESVFIYLLFYFFSSFFFWSLYTIACGIEKLDEKEEEEKREKIQFVPIVSYFSISNYFHSTDCSLYHRNIKYHSLFSSSMLRISNISMSVSVHERKKKKHMNLILTHLRTSSPTYFCTVILPSDHLYRNLKKTTTLTHSHHTQSNNVHFKSASMDVCFNRFIVIFPFHCCIDTTLHYL